MPERKVSVDRVTSEALTSIGREREREIITRRFGLTDRKETLEQIGELLGITRERVRQLEKAVTTKLKALASEGKLRELSQFEKELLDTLQIKGNIARISELGVEFTKANSQQDQAKIAFLSTLAPNVLVINDNDHFYHGVAIASVHKDEKNLRTETDKVIEAIKKLNKPATIDVVAKTAGYSDVRHAGALANISKHLAYLNGKWGLIKWPSVNPRNIRDKIYVILSEKGKQMHFSEIAESIKESGFKRKDVTTQAIHNELIKDKRFVLVGRGIYALKEWGYERGTVADVIAEVLRKEGAPLHRDEIVKRVLKSRFVKETTILLNLQGKTQFKRVSKATYALTD